MLSYATHIILDAARMGEYMAEAQELNRDFYSLYRGTAGEALSEVAPHIFTFSENSEFANWYYKNGWGNSWGILLKSSLPLADVFKHFRKFLMVQTEDGGELYFRFYDPRVLRIFLPTCHAKQLNEFFGPVDYFLVEAENATSAIRYRLENGILKSDTIAAPGNNSPVSIQNSFATNVIQPSEKPEQHPNKKTGWKKFE